MEFVLIRLQETRQKSAKASRIAEYHDQKYSSRASSGIPSGQCKGRPSKDTERPWNRLSGSLRELSFLHESGRVTNSMCSLLTDPFGKLAESR